jgi:hypothetical protein
MPSRPFNNISHAGNSGQSSIAWGDANVPGEDPAHTQDTVRPGLHSYNDYLSSHGLGSEAEHKVSLIKTEPGLSDRLDFDMTTLQAQNDDLQHQNERLLQRVTDLEKQLDQAKHLNKEHQAKLIAQTQKAQNENEKLRRIVGEFVEKEPEFKCDCRDGPCEDLHQHNFNSTMQVLLNKQSQTASQSPKTQSPRQSDIHNLLSP